MTEEIKEEMLIPEGRKMDIVRHYNIGDFSHVKFTVSEAVSLPEGLSPKVSNLLVLRQLYNMDYLALVYLKNSVFLEGKYKDQILRGELEDAFAEVEKQKKKVTVGLKQAWAEINDQAQQEKTMKEENND